MLAIRMQRTGRKGHAQFRVVVQDSRLTPTSGRVVALLGSYDPHAKTNTLAKDKAVFYLSHGAQPSPRVIRLLESEGVELPAWVKKPEQKNRTTKNPEKLRVNQPKTEEKAEPAAPAEEPAAETTAESVADAPAEAEVVLADEPTEAEAPASDDAVEPESTEPAEEAAEKPDKAEPADEKDDKK